MSEIQKETDEIIETAGYINMPAGTLYYKTYGKKCDTQGKNRLPLFPMDLYTIKNTIYRERSDFRWCSFMEIGALTGIFLLI